MVDWQLPQLSNPLLAVKLKIFTTSRFFGEELASDVGLKQVSIRQKVAQVGNFRRKQT